MSQVKRLARRCTYFTSICRTDQRYSVATDKSSSIKSKFCEAELLCNAFSWRPYVPKKLFVQNLEGNIYIPFKVLSVLQQYTTCEPMVLELTYTAFFETRINIWLFVREFRLQSYESRLSLTFSSFFRNRPCSLANVAICKSRCGSWVTIFLGRLSIRALFSSAKCFVSDLRPQCS